VFLWVDAQLLLGVSIPRIPQLESRMELYPHVHQIQSLFGGRNLFQYLLWVITRCLSIRHRDDAGASGVSLHGFSPAQPSRLTLAVTTHADMDHQAGNDAIKRASPGTWLSCGAADRAWWRIPRRSTIFAIIFSKPTTE